MLRTRWPARSEHLPQLLDDPRESEIIGPQDLTPAPASRDVFLSPTVYVLVYSVFARFGTFYKLLRDGHPGAPLTIGRSASAGSRSVVHREP
jgi:hypothetical protein